MLFVLDIVGFITTHQGCADKFNTTRQRNMICLDGLGCVIGPTTSENKRSMLVDVYLYEIFCNIALKL